MKISMNLVKWYWFSWFIDLFSKLFLFFADAIVDEYKGLGYQARRGCAEIDRSSKLNVRRTRRRQLPIVFQLFKILPIFHSDRKYAVDRTQCRRSGKKKKFGLNSVSFKLRLQLRNFNMTMTFRSATLSWQSYRYYL